MLKPFIGSYRDSWAYGGYENIDVFIAANTESEALGMILEQYPTKTTKCWSIQEMHLDEPYIEYISSDGS